MNTLRSTLDWIAADAKREQAVRDAIAAGRPIWTVNHGLRDELAEQAIAMLDGKKTTAGDCGNRQTSLFE